MTGRVVRLHSMTFLKLACRVAAALLLVGVGVRPAAAGPITIEATANIFAAGESLVDGHDPIGGGTGTLPPSFSFAAGPGQSIVFDFLNGNASCCGGDLSNGPDGNTGMNFTDIPSFSGISGIVAGSDATNGTWMFLVGVFTDGTNIVPTGVPDPTAPPRLDFTSAASQSFTSLSPLLFQTFWIGDGLTGNGTGTQQVFNVPVGATNLYLGFADAFMFHNTEGGPGFYGDNVGAVTMDVTLQPVPEPGTIVLLGSGLIGAVARRLRRRSA